MEDATLADLAFAEFEVDTLNLPGPPSTMAEGFAEPDDQCLAMAAHLGTATAPTVSIDLCPGDAVRGFALVYQGVKLNSHEASCDEAKASIKKELDNIVGNTFDYSHTVRGKCDVANEVSDALFVYSHLLTGVKNAESSQTGAQVWKARLVAGEHFMHDGDGLRFTESDLYGAPASLEGVSAVVWRSTLSPECDLLQADIAGAYIQARLLGRPTFLERPKRPSPGPWFRSDGSQRYRHPVLRLRRAMYGLRRSGFRQYETRGAGFAAPWVDPSGRCG